MWLDKNITVADGADKVKEPQMVVVLQLIVEVMLMTTLTYASSDDTWNVNKTFKVNSAEVATQGFAVAMAIAL